MKNKFNIVLAILWLLIALFFCWLLFSKFSNGSSHFSFNAQFADKVFGDDGITINFDDLSFGDINTLYKSYPFNSAHFEKFNVSTVSESVHFQPYEGSEYLVELYGNWNEKLEPEITQEGKTLKIKTPTIKKSIGNRKIVIKVPEGESSKLFDTDVSCVSGSIHSSDLCFSDFTADVTSGSVHFDGTADTLNAGTISGSIHVNGTCGNIDAESTSGSIHVSGTCGNIDADTVSGSIHFETDEPLTGKNVFNSTSGSINIAIPEDSGCEFEWNTVSGSVSNEFYKGKCGKSGSQIIGDGDTRINAETVSGSIHLNMN